MFQESFFNQPLPLFWTKNDEERHLHACTNAYADARARARACLRACVRACACICRRGRVVRVSSTHAERGTPDERQEIPEQHCMCYNEDMDQCAVLYLVGRCASCRSSCQLSRHSRKHPCCCFGVSRTYNLKCALQQGNAVQWLSLANKSRAGCATNKQ